MANRITGKDAYISLIGEGTTGNRSYCGEVDSFNADYTAEHVDTRPVSSKAPFHQMTGSTWHVSLQGGVTDSLYFWIATIQDTAYQRGDSLPKWSLVITASNPATHTNTINCSFNSGMIYTANLQVGKAHELMTQQCEMYFDHATIHTA